MVKKLARLNRPQALTALAPLEVLNGALVFIRRSLGVECAKISSFPGLRILLPRIQPVLSRF